MTLPKECLNTACQPEHHRNLHDSTDSGFFFGLPFNILTIYHTKSLTAFKKVNSVSYSKHLVRALLRLMDTDTHVEVWTTEP